MARLGRGQPFAPIQFGAIAEVTNTTFAADQGSYTLTGFAVNLLWGRKLTAAQGSYGDTGQPVGLSRNVPITAAQGSYTLSGQSANLLHGYKLSAAQGSYSLNGQTVTLTYGTAKTLTADTGFYAVSGQAIAFRSTYVLAAQQGSYVLGGVAVNLQYGVPEEPQASKAAGRPKRKRRRYYVEIDGQEFEVSGADEAAVLLSRAREVAQTAIEKARAAPVRINHGLSRPRIKTADPELAPIVAQARREILDLYDEAIRDLEIKALMAKADEEEEEALIRLLM